jgi:elongation factor P--(R)-beta-lysine ligase
MNERLWRPSAPLAALHDRARLNALIRAFFDARGVLEVETPLLSAAGNSDPAIESFRVAESTHQRWLRTSPEFPMKRLLAAGAGPIYELGRVFRSGEQSHRHNPEFTMLEWYRPGFTLAQLIDEVIALTRTAAQAFSAPLAAVTTLSYAEWFRRSVGIDPHTATLADFAALNPDFSGALDRDAWQQLTIANRIEATHAANELTIVHSYPASQSALAQIAPGNPPTAQRFEVYWGAMELANGYFELRDPAEQRARFDADLKRRAARDQSPVQLDEHLLAALEHGLPECAGVALGVDRLLQKLTGADSISEVLAFGSERA